LSIVNLQPKLDLARVIRLAINQGVEGRTVLVPTAPQAENRAPDAERLMRIPVGGGVPELVLSGEKIWTFSCAREANLCVAAEEVEGRQILTTFDPLTGREKRTPGCWKISDKQ
jgi:hypothetical protein